MHAAAIRVELLLRDVSSLKEKRSRLKGVARRLRDRYPVAVAEIDHQDLWKRATLGVAVVAGQNGQLNRLLHSVIRWFESQDDLEVLETVTAFMVEE
ncbi:MAG TPA: DUF503 domain-containing protein [Acidimicrobiia bacterium]